MKGLQFLLKIAIVASIVGHMILSPYTKVEESFNLQAIHDILNYGIFPFSVLDQYDHKTFPGVVPRTFVGALLVAGIVTPIIKVLEFFDVDLLAGDQTNLQLLVRLVIGVANAFLLIKLADTANRIDFQSRKFKRKPLIGTCYLLLLASQFHILFYSSRTLPNFMALPFVNYALAKLMRGDMIGLSILAFTGIVFRLEIGVFSVVATVVFSLIFKQSDIFVNLLMLVVGTITGVMISVSVDTQFWGHLILPEIQSLVYNVVEGKSANWGVEPFPTYFTKYIPKLFKPPVVLMLSAIGFTNDPSDDNRVFRTKDSSIVHRPCKDSLRALFVSSILFVLVMSFQPHKEWRFIIYIVPVVTLLGGNGLATLIHKSKGSFSRKILVFFFLVLTAVSSIISLFTSYVSSFNYPGGQAVKVANELAYSRAQSNMTSLIHLDVATCMSGASRFTELHNIYISYDKTETPEELKNIWNNIDILVTEDHINTSDWENVDSVKIFSRVSLYPIISYLQTHSSFAQIQADVITLYNDSVKQKSLDAIFKILDQVIIKTDYLFIYERSEQTLEKDLYFERSDSKESPQEDTFEPPTDGIPYLPGQKLNGCGCSDQDHSNPDVGRGEIENNLNQQMEDIEQDLNQQIDDIESEFN